MKKINQICFILTVIGGFNWGLVGLFGINLVPLVSAGIPLISKIIYGLIGFSSIVALMAKLDIKM
jgi:uncharacterized membrane protein YuzA (DUF378 family)